MSSGTLNPIFVRWPNSLIFSQGGGDAEVFLPYCTFWRRAKKINYQGFLTIELGFQYTIDPDAAVYKSRQFLLDQMKKIKETTR